MQPGSPSWETYGGSRSSIGTSETHTHTWWNPSPAPEALRKSKHYTNRLKGPCSQAGAAVEQQRRSARHADARAVRRGGGRRCGGRRNGRPDQKDGEGRGQAHDGIHGGPHGGAGVELHGIRHPEGFRKAPPPRQVRQPPAQALPRPGAGKSLSMFPLREWRAFECVRNGAFDPERFCWKALALVVFDTASAAQIGMVVQCSDRDSS
jgi:hypothetical protein